MSHRCPKHPDGCPKHPNPNPPKGRPGNPANRRRVSELRSSFTDLVAAYHTPGSGNPRNRRRLIPRSRWEASL